MKQSTKTILSILALLILVAGIILLALYAPKPTTSGVKNTTTAPTTGVQSTIQEKYAMIAETIGISKNAFLSCVESPETKAVVDADISLGKQLGVKGTPFFVAVLKDGTAFKIPGAFPDAAFHQALDLGKIPEGFAGIDPSELSDILALANSKNAGTIVGTRDGKYAGIRLIELGDIDCYYCQQVHPTVQKLVSEGAAWTWLHFPLDIHPNAYDKALASSCVQKLSGSNAFFKFIDLLMI